MDSPEHSDVQYNADDVNNDNGEISLRQQPRIPMPSAQSNTRREPPVEPPPNRFLDFRAVAQAQLDAALGPDAPSQFGISSKSYMHTARPTFENGAISVTRGQVASDLKRPPPAKSTPQLSAVNQAPSNIADPFVHAPSNEMLATTIDVPFTHVQETRNYNRPFQVGDEVHVLDPKGNDQSGVVTYIVSGTTSEGDVCTIRSVRDLVVPTGRLLRAPVRYMDQVDVFKPRLRTKNGHQTLAVEKVDSGLVKQRSVVDGKRKYNVVSLTAQQTYTDLDDNMIALVARFDPNTGDYRPPSNSHE